jgi:glycosyltransferase involved in cell wall biosynthesis
MTAPTVAVVDLGRCGALGAARRVESWTRIFSAAGARVEVVRLVAECGTGAARLLPSLAVAGVHPERVPESALWRPTALRDRLSALDPAVVVITTARSFAPRTVPASARLVLDYVDHLSVNYAERARLTPNPLRAAALRMLAWQMGRFERLPLPGSRRVAAGASDAAVLGAEWVPNVVALADAVPAAGRIHDVLFVGTLDYAPNVAALHRLSRLWPELQRVRPGTSLLVAGSTPTAEIRALADRQGWTLWENFSSLSEVCGAARVALAPLQHGTGIQNKVLEAAAHGLPQVVAPAVLAGVGLGFPAVVAATDQDVVRETAALLDDPERRAQLATAGRRVVADRFGVDRWVAWARELLADVPAAPASSPPATAGTC